MRNSGFYYNRDGLRIQPAEVKAKMKDPAYRIVRSFENDTVRLEVLWTGMGGDPNDSLPDFWPLFELQVFNMNSSGARAPDPIDHGKVFPTEKKAIAAYEEFLVKWGGGELGQDGEFVEVGNEAEPPKPVEPPKPPPPDQPTTTIAGLNDDGAW